MTAPGEFEKSLVPFSESEAAIEQYKAGGIIEHALGAPEQSMDRMIQGHLGEVALFEARGDNTPERPMYIFNPESRLLINFALRRSAVDFRSGLFADVVELGEDGKPRQGVSAVNPFQTSTGFIRVAVGENQRGFAPTHVDLKLDSNNPLDVVPPNLAAADLIALLTNEPIAENETVQQFLKRTSAEREEQRAKVRRSNEYRYMPTDQGLSELTNPFVHWIISDRDVSALAEASRAVGLFPLVITVDALIGARRTLHKAGGVDEFDLRSGSWISRSKLYEEADSIPAFITFDYASDTRQDSETGRERTVQAIEGNYQYNRLELAKKTVEQLVANNPVFTVLSNPGLNEEVGTTGFGGRVFSQEEIEIDLANMRLIEKRRHGLYEQAIKPDDEGSMKEYTDWLRKVKLDFALTLYLRSLSQL